jgi:transcriptional regulator with XRE-family HTH domain
MKNLKLLRERHKLTQAELAERVGTTQQTVARWESGKAEPSVATLRDLAVCLMTSVDYLLGREPVLDPQSINPFAWTTGDKTGYWGNIGLTLPRHKHSTWYPITTDTMERLFSSFQTVQLGDWISFQTLNNKMVACNPNHIQLFTFLDEAEDEVEGDWEVGPDAIEGWPHEIYECLEHILWSELGAEERSDAFSDALMSRAKELIAENNLDEQQLMEMCVRTRVIHTDGMVRFLEMSPERLVDAIFTIDLGRAGMDCSMLHLDDEFGDHSVFLSFGQIACIEFPLSGLKQGLEDQHET